MKLDIDIPDSLYRIIQEDDIKTASHTVWVMFMIEAIKNGVPHVNTDRIEDIRSDIDTLKFDTMYRYVGDFRYGVDTVVAIIDKHTKGVNE